ncbi:hypothetical protein H5410_046258 [Solanum commersonii]|uniref:Uncharacterized protein n=1 Tax=Solanum commersonii TaxID=4109 RepID=A0A9J5XG01_SOLCO|nr:hypothetical protein H5410_046258 [Solanum commersonii]
MHTSSKLQIQETTINNRSKNIVVDAAKSRMEIGNSSRSKSDEQEHAISTNLIRNLQNIGETLNSSTEVLH